ncbi:CDF family Co(II)/Ni(II) efflux transporter DmeF [Altererythrobacter xixiisoli]|uniref:CDF family Co(II)/Ni(II) efflux transporter DmeF n=1 Tax=Croceibacterium xixiisoli TaxID=1476466 RepID=A0A6I4TWK3_9SPHN|nr:CDF family Co(II)/Ni(II) efflux transporter DmeF [Croceibacterium xixiisoli]MXP00417.1 CDF family Co(II)/Ni(II) efflux transporter DmeF [Croceibacterium xixiisoli]
MSIDLDSRRQTHDFLGASHDENAKRTLWVVALTAVMMVIEIIAGYWTGSMALLADGFHMATHAGALGIAAIAYRYAKANVGNTRFSFGTGKIGELAGFASAMVLGMVALGIAWESVIRLANPTGVAFGEATIVAVVGLVVNLVSAALLMGGHSHGHGHGHGHGHHHSHAHHHHHHDDDDHDHQHGHDHDDDHGHGTATKPGKKTGHDNNLRAAYVHVLADALTSVLAIVALLAGRYLGWVWLDPLMGIVGAVVITRWAWSLMRDTGAILLDMADPQLLKEIHDCVEAPGDARIADVHIWQVGPQAHAAIVDVIGHVTPAQIRQRLLPVHEIAHLTVAVEPPHG